MAMLRFGCTHISDHAFLSAFVEGSLSPRNFHRGDHLRAAALLLDRLPFEDALVTVRSGLQTLAQHAGKADHYHETVTRGWLVLLAAHGYNDGFVTLLAAYPEHINPLHAFWSEEVLSSEAARVGWVTPDLTRLPPLRHHPHATLTRG